MFIFIFAMWNSLVFKNAVETTENGEVLRAFADNVPVMVQMVTVASDDSYIVCAGCWVIRDEIQKYSAYTLNG